jgi:hypothetical protein
MSDLVALEIIGHAAQTNAKVARAEDTGYVFYGTARSIGDQNGMTAFGTDVRDQFLRVTLRGGSDAFWPVRDLMADVHNGDFAETDW